MLKCMCHTLHVLVVSGQRIFSVDRMPLVWQHEGKDKRKAALWSLVAPQFSQQNSVALTVLGCSSCSHRTPSKLWPQFSNCPINDYFDRLKKMQILS